MYEQRFNLTSVRPCLLQGSGSVCVLCSLLELHHDKRLKLKDSSFNIRKNSVFSYCNNAALVGSVDRRLFGWLVGRSVFQFHKKGRKVTLPCSCRSTCLFQNPRFVQNYQHIMQDLTLRKQDCGFFFRDLNTEPVLSFHKINKKPHVGKKFIAYFLFNFYRTLYIIKKKI